MHLSLEQLARAAGEPLDRVREWQAAGLVGATEPFGPPDIERLRLIGLLRRRGVSLEDIAASRGDIDAFGTRHRPATTSLRTLAEAAAEVGLDPALVERAWRASGLSVTDLLDDRDVAFIRHWRTVRDVGHPDDALVEMARVMGDTVRRATEAMARVTHFHIIRPIVARGLTGVALRDAIAEATGRLVPAAPLMVEHLTRRLLAEASRENFALRFLDDRSAPGELIVGLVFVDLCSFTPIADAMGDHESADVLARFSALVRDAAVRWDGRVVKQIGDAFMLSFVGPGAAVACALEIERRAAAEPRFPALRAGINWGRVLYRDGDYVGANVNVAARVADEAGRHEVFVTEAVRRAAAPVGGIEFRPVGRRRLKGVSDEVELFRAVAVDETATARVVDPVCGMEIGAAEAAARLALGDRELAFCSAQCLQRYVADPARYGR
ncbi:MAG TPA: adenylate cyclase regulatory domain-containing protein [Candidatus Binatia bacterium]|nr:adenylate cyclase regulatory domain-containing protein [Candidatus Binatia bacterium]